MYGSLIFAADSDVQMSEEDIVDLAEGRIDALLADGENAALLEANHASLSDSDKLKRDRLNAELALSLEMIALCDYSTRGPEELVAFMESKVPGGDFDVIANRAYEYRVAGDGWAERVAYEGSEADWSKYGLGHALSQAWPEEAAACAAQGGGVAAQQECLLSTPSGQFFDSFIDLTVIHNGEIGEFASAEEQAAYDALREQRVQDAKVQMGMGLLGFERDSTALVQGQIVFYHGHADAWDQSIDVPPEMLDNMEEVFGWVQDFQAAYNTSMALAYEDWACLSGTGVQSDVLGNPDVLEAMLNGDLPADSRCIDYQTCGMSQMFFMPDPDNPDSLVVNPIAAQMFPDELSRIASGEPVDVVMYDAFSKALEGGEHSTHAAIMAQGTASAALASAPGGGGAGFGGMGAVRNVAIGRTVAEMRLPSLASLRPPNGGRAPTIGVDEGLGRTGSIRSSLDVGGGRTVAYSDVNVTGLQGEVIGVSGAASRGNSLDSSTIAGNTTRTGPGRLDAEVKILDHLRTQISPDSTGTIRLFIDQPAGRGACQSCTDAILQFRRDYPGIDLVVSAN